MSDEQGKVDEKFVSEGAKKIRPGDVEKALRKMGRVVEIASRVEALRPLLAKLVVLGKMLSDYWGGKYKGVPWASIAAIAFAILYVANPFDIIPDFIPVVGYVDDATVVALVWMAVESDARKYARWKVEQGDTDEETKVIIATAFPDISGV